VPSSFLFFLLLVIVYVLYSRVKRRRHAGVQAILDLDSPNRYTVTPNPMLDLSLLVEPFRLLKDPVTVTYTSKTGECELICFLYHPS
jgi:hypothetical protein